MRSARRTPRCLFVAPPSSQITPLALAWVASSDQELMPDFSSPIQCPERPVPHASLGGDGHARCRARAAYFGCWPRAPASTAGCLVGQWRIPRRSRLASRSHHDADFAERRVELLLFNSSPFSSSSIRLFSSRRWPCRPTGQRWRPFANEPSMAFLPGMRPAPRLAPLPLRQSRFDAELLVRLLGKSIPLCSTSSTTTTASSLSWCPSEVAIVAWIADGLYVDAFHGSIDADVLARGHA